MSNCIVLVHLIHRSSVDVVVVSGADLKAPPFRAGVSHDVVGARGGVVVGEELVNKCPATEA